VAGQLWFKTSVKDNVRYIHVHQLVATLGVEMTKTLPGFHALTGCDSTSAVNGIGKKAWKELQWTASENQGVGQLGDTVPPSEHTVSACEKFICSIYTKSTKAGTTVDELRYWMFCQKKQKNESLSPTTDSLRQHIGRDNYQAAVWKRSLEAIVDIPPTDGNGWTFTDGHLEPALMCKDPAPTGLLELTECKCEKSAC